MKLKVVCVCSAPLPFQGTGVVVVVVAEGTEKNEHGEEGLLLLEPLLS